MTELTPGLELGARFALIRRLGSGGTAEVWLAADALRGEQVALKIFLDQSDSGLAARLAGELARVRALGTDCAVPIHDVLQAGEHTLVVMEFQPGGELGQFRGRSFDSWKKAADDVVAALSAAHAANLVHRDLKCSNVLLDAAGRARLSDFGLSALAGAEVAAGGSPYNASPQQLRGEPAAAADDLYALGAMLYELIAGHPPYYPEITRERVLYEPVPPLLPRGTVPVGVRELALRLLAKAPQDRPADAAGLRERLAAAAEEGGEIEPAVLPASVAQARAGGRRWLPFALVAAAAAIVAIFIWLPKYIAGHQAIVEVAREDAKAEGQQRAAAEQKAEDVAKQKTASEEARGRFDKAFKALDEHAAANWATEAFARSRVQGEQAAQRHAVGDYAAARQAWDAAAQQLAVLEKDRPRALAAGARSRQGGARAGEDRGGSRGL